MRKKERKKKNTHTQNSYASNSESFDKRAVTVLRIF